jgi:sialidase-1
LMHKPFEKGRRVSVTKIRADSDWKLFRSWAPADSLPTRRGFVGVPVLETTIPGASLRYHFRGNAIGLSVLSDADAGTISFSVDHGEWKEINLVTQWSNSLHLPWFVLLASGLAPGRHELQLTFLGKGGNKSGLQACRILKLLVNED